MAFSPDQVDTEGMGVTVQNLSLLAGVIAAFVLLALLVNTSGNSSEPTDTRSCAELAESFAVYSKLIETHDRSWSQWEAVDAEKWAVYDLAHAKGCDGF
jgi:hypothetical protein